MPPLFLFTKKGTDRQKKLTIGHEPFTGGRARQSAQPFSNGVKPKPAVGGSNRQHCLPIPAVSVLVLRVFALLTYQKRTVTHCRLTSRRIPSGEKIAEKRSLDPVFDSGRLLYGIGLRHCLHNRHGQAAGRTNRHFSRVAAMVAAADRVAGVTSPYSHGRRFSASVIEDKKATGHPLPVFGANVVHCRTLQANRSSGRK